MPGSAGCCWLAISLPPGRALWASVAAQVAAAGALMAGITWKSRTGGDDTPLAGLTVKAATMLQEEVVKSQAERRARFGVFAGLAGDTRPADVAAKRVLAMLGRLWRGPCKNKYNEVMWRLIINALPLASRMAGTDLGGCPCGHSHHFWACPIAEGVLATSRRSSPPPPPLPQPSLACAGAPRHTLRGVGHGVPAGCGGNGQGPPAGHAHLIHRLPRDQLRPGEQLVAEGHRRGPRLRPVRDAVGLAAGDVGLA